MNDKGAGQQQSITGAITNQMKELVEMKESFKEEQVKFIKGLINPDLTDNELYMFLIYAHRGGLNPFAKEIIAVVYNKNVPAERKVNTIIPRDGKRTVAERKGGLTSVETEPIYTKVFKVDTGRFSAPNEPIYEDQVVRVKPWEGGTLWGATCTVIRNGKTFTTTVPLKEYNTGKNVWAGKPETMIKKVAESQALSQAVPELLGTYDEAEMPSEARQTATALIEGYDEPATDEMLQTLRILKGDMDRTYTKQEAMDTIADLTAKKPKKEKEPVPAEEEATA